MSKKVYLDPGHGGSDPGAVRNGLREKDLTLAIAKRIEKILKKDYEGVQVKLSRTTDKFVSLSNRAKMANDWEADVFVSIHINAGGGTGYEDFIYNKLSNSSTTAKMRDTFHKEVVKEQSFWRNRGKKKANFAVLRLTNMSGILTENGFIDTKSDANKLKSNTHLNRIAKGHAGGIAKALGLKKKSKPKNSTSSSKKSSSSSKKTSTSKSTYTGNSIVDYLKSIGEDSSFNHRKALASKHGISNYTGTAAQNTRLLNALRGNKTSTKATTTKKYTPRTFKVGQKVKIKSSAKKYSRSNVSIPTKYKNKSLTIQQVGKDDVLIKELYSWVRKSDTY